MQMKIFHLAELAGYRKGQKKLGEILVSDMKAITEETLNQALMKQNGIDRKN
jgi:hypothetical protein